MTFSCHTLCYWSYSCVTVVSLCQLHRTAHVSHPSNHGWLRAVILVPSPICHKIVSLKKDFFSCMTFQSLLPLLVELSAHIPPFGQYFACMMRTHILSDPAAMYHISFSKRAILKMVMSRIPKPPSSYFRLILCQPIRAIYLTLSNFPQKKRRIVDSISWIVFVGNFSIDI